MLKKILITAWFLFSISLALTAEEGILEAAKNGDIETVKTILANDPDKLNTLDEDDYTPLHWACMRTRWNIAEHLINNGADLNVQGGDGGTPINWAVHHDNVEIVNLMVEKGAKLNIQNQWGHDRTAHRNLAGMYPCGGISVGSRIRPDNEGWTAMHYVFRSGHDNVIELLKNKGVSLKVQNNTGRYTQHLYFKKPNPIAMTNDELDEYIGKYYLGDYLMLEIWRESNRLKSMEFGPDEIYPVAKEFFYFKQAPWTLIFSRDEKGKLHHAQLSFIRRSYTIKRK